MRGNVLLCLLFVLASANIYGQRNCGAMDHLHHQMEQDPKMEHKLQQIEEFTNHYILNHKETGERMVITIPVVFHVVYRTSTENLSASRLQDQLDVLNADFRRLNGDADNTWSQAADVEIEFCLATVDPNGNATDGITRTSTSVNGFGTNDAVKSASSGGKDAWPAGDYLNFWVCNIGGGILGYAQFPGGSPATDGVVNDYRYTGTTGATAPFNLGRTATHEVGHWLNLRHIWGDGGCNVDDFVSDTPTSDAPNYGCTPTHVSCNSTDMVQNYMDYSDDACMNLFTQGQKNRMRALFSPGGARASLETSNGCGSGNPPPPPPTGCDDNEVTVSITLDNYPEETSWSITNASGATVASGGTYGSQPDGSTVTIDACLVDGCYDFTINDSYGDGICCAYGSGSYTVSSGGASLASGGSFGSTETTNFCVGNSTPAPTCNDGVQNGGETGVDCGGPDCAPCSSCNDGVQNGNETGVDCGGPDCSACPTCNDGVQNGNETGTDCGGPDCNACPTCNDGVQNGGETGVDCGGPDCAPCSTGGSDVLLGSFFESGLDGWIDGGSDCYRYSGSRSYEGSYSIRIRDNSGSASSMTSPSLNLAGYSSVDVEFYFYPNSMENGEDFWLRYNSGSGWQTVATWARGSNFNNNTFYTATVTLSAADYNLTNGAKFRFQCDASANADRVYIDAVTITGNGSGSRVAPVSSSSMREMPGESHTTSIDDIGLEIYPNPASDVVNITAEETIQSVTIMDVTGRVLSSKRASADQTTINVTDLKSGLYLLSVETEEEVTTRKFVKF